MNRFLTRKKDRAADDNGSAKKTKKGKKGQQEPEPQLDLATALPSTDDFRTSLIMPSLSTRFSMLREQDDPTSKLGKASDDSVLQPKRKSRLHEFGFVPGGLSDIAEVSSLNGSIRPPFAVERQGSFDSHNTEESTGSVMSRARPGEGNVLFGGRQKIYKISNTASSKSLGRQLYDDDVHLSAFQRLRLQEKERLAAEKALEGRDDEESEPPSPGKDAYSPSTSGYSQRRETSSSTNSASANARSSTAATSVASQGPSAVPASSPSLPDSTTPASPTELNRSGTKARRLYDQALDQHMYDQQSSAINRLNSIQRAKAPTGRSTPPLLYSQPRSATNLHDRFNKGGPLASKDATSNTSSPNVSRPQSPPLVSPIGSDNEEARMLKSALQPNDRGKATAMGAFNKPKQAFSEQQYAERLKQLQQDRDASAEKPGNPRKPSLRDRAEWEQRKRAESGASDKGGSRVTAGNEDSVSAESERPSSRSSDNKNGASIPSVRPGPFSPAPEKNGAPSPFAVFQSAANQMKIANAQQSGDISKQPEISANRAPQPPNLPESSPKSPDRTLQDAKSPDSQQGGTFFASPGSSDDEDDAPKTATMKPTELDRRFQNLPTATGPAPPLMDHPAMRSRSPSHSEPFDHPALRSRSNSRAPPPRSALRDRSTSRPPPPRSALRDRSNSRPAMGDLPQHPALRSRSNSRPAQTPPIDTSASPKASPKAESAPKEEDKDVDSPTLGPTNGGLSGLIRQHLRSVSNVSSDYGEDNNSAGSPPPTNNTLALRTRDVGAGARQPASETNTTTLSSYSHSNPWDLDDLDTYGDGSVSSVSPVDAQKPKIPDQSNTAMLITPQAINETISEWEKEMKKTHKREPSVEEREAFQRELALRQRAVQETLRNKSNMTEQNRTRNASPAPGGGSLKSALNMLRAKSSRDSFATIEPKQPDASHKAMKVLGMGASSANASSTSLAGERDPPLRPKPTRILQQSEQDAQRELENRQRSATNDSSRDPLKGKTPPQSSNSSVRGRSSSEVSTGRSQSRHRQYRDDLDQAMASGSRNTVYPPNDAASGPVSGFVANATQPLPAERSTMDDVRKRSRSNSRTTAATYFESKHLQPIQTGPGQGASNGTSPRLTPGTTPMHQFSPGLPASPRPSPGAASPSVNSFRAQPSPIPPTSARNTPPVSGASTPIAPVFHTGAAAIMPTSGTLRKKSINKADISDPIFLSTTSVIDTVNLPAGASLKNGSEEPPPLPPINPMRRRFGFGRSPSDESSSQGSSTPYGESVHTNSSETLASKASQPRQKLRKTSSEGKSLHGKAQVQTGNSPAMPTLPFGARNGSPPRPINHTPIAQQNMNGAMF